MKIISPELCIEICFCENIIENIFPLSSKVTLISQISLLNHIINFIFYELFFIGAKNPRIFQKNSSSHRCRLYSLCCKVVFIRCFFRISCLWCL